MRLIAHRGASGHAPENTRASFRLALEMGAKAVELDVHQTKDHELAVIHDEDFKRVGKRKVLVRDLSWAETQALDVGSWFDKRFAGERVSRLGDVMALVEGKAELHIELKRGSRVYPGIEERVVDLIQRRKAWDWAPVSSFDHEALYAARSLDSRLRLGYLVGLTSMKRAYLEISELKAESVNMSLRQVDAAKVRECHKRGLQVLVYTVNAQKDLDRMTKLGVDGVFTNFPELEGR